MTFNASHSGTINVPATTDHLHEIREFLRERIRASGLTFDAIAADAVRYA